MSEPLTLYKLMILYMLKQVKFPLSGSQISEFFLDKEYTTYFTLQQALSELIEAHLIKLETTRNSSRYEITSEGEETLTFFGKKISSAIIDDINEYLKENKVRLRDEVGVLSDYYKSTNQDYIVHCAIREGKTQLLEINLSVPDREQADHMCARWNRESQKIYSFLMQTLMKE
ncbi:MAG TPA: DUF4364 family protein [Firmicutes bacterium]|nr:DUF4364 family protein [Bacillota bacterium]